MWNLMELRQALHDLKAEGTAIINAAKDENRAFTDAENARLSEIEAKMSEVSANIENAEAAAARERAMAPDPIVATIERTSDFSNILPPIEGQVDPADMCGFNHLADFALSVRNASRSGGPAPDARLTAMVAQSYGAAPTNFHQEQGTEEGYEVPAAFRQEIWRLVFSGLDLLTLVSPEPTVSNAVTIIADETTPWGATGVQANWRAEGTQMSPSKLDTKGRLVRLHDLYAFVLATDELLEDAPRLQNRLTVQAAEAIRWKASDAIAYGTGVGQPFGYFNSGALVSVAKEAAQPADTIVAANVVKMFSRMLAQGITQAVWLANSDIIPQLMTMVLGNQPIWTPPATGFVNAPGGFLFGRPVLFSEHAKTLGDKGDLQFIDPMGYYATNKANGITFASSIHLYFDYAIQAFRWTFRIGGEPFLSAPVVPANGSNTKSHFVTLDERA